MIFDELKKKIGTHLDFFLRFGRIFFSEAWAQCERTREQNTVRRCTCDQWNPLLMCKLITVLQRIRTHTHTHGLNRCCVYIYIFCFRRLQVLMHEYECVQTHRVQPPGEVFRCNEKKKNKKQKNTKQIMAADVEKVEYKIDSAYLPTSIV